MSYSRFNSVLDMENFKGFFKFLCFLLYIHLLNAKKNGDCPIPYSQCNLGKDGMINVHIVPHTHDDVG